MIKQDWKEYSHLGCAKTVAQSAVCQEVDQILLTIMLPKNQWLIYSLNFLITSSNKNSGPITKSTRALKIVLRRQAFHLAEQHQ